ncbi:MAG: ABC transporter ATP-binding protein [Thermoguttaceae bacterium]|jgi:ABC-type lipoprotein export system ATPase subunit
MLELRQVTKSFTLPDGSPLNVLDIEHFHAKAGEQVVIVGQSGCGKTTLLHVIAGICRPDAGRVLIDGWDIPVLSEADRDQFRAAKIGYVFQTFNLLPAFSALENVMIGMTFADGRADRDRAKMLLERVGLSHRLTHKPSQLSVGEQQRVAVARAMANRPKVLLADEPTANIDTGNQQQVIDMLRGACEVENVVLLLVTHSPEVARQFDRVERLEEINRVLVKRS